MTFDASGNMYGTTRIGGTVKTPFGLGDGTVWELTKGNNTITALASFNGTNGSSPYSGVTMDASGNLYGTATNGGANGVDGTVWELAKGAKSITALASFSGANGSHPVGGVTFDGSGNLFGTADTLGRYLEGTVWELAKGTGTIAALGSFNGTNGINPLSGATFGPDGNVYGTANGGGAGGTGTVWIFTIPEPSSLVLGMLVLAMSGCAVVARRRRED